SDYVIRSTQSRVKYKGESFPPAYTPDMVKGDVMIESDLYTRYAGELQLARKEMKNSGKTNVVARVVEEERFLIDLIEPWGKFAFKLKR
ncbi:MAG: phospho-sugar glycosidase domain-containing protein, partial [Clostridium sp.]|uniref:phospho-sugar glycosidase domain-containing protein n=1 Tax=Clostridium sp. TaxID=1506 RepID=UPI003F39F4FF